MPGREGFVERPNGTRIRTLAWPVANPVGRVQLVHGLSEHMGRYEELAAALNGAGYSAYGHDHRGHGKSDGRRGVAATVPQLVDDLVALRNEADTLAPGPGAPFLVAHSMGGLVAVRALQTRYPDDPGVSWSGLVLSAPWLETAMKIPFLKRIVLPIVRALAPEVPIPQPIQPERLTADPDQALRYANDPLVVRALSVSFFDEAQRAQQVALAACPAPELDVLVLLPELDELADSRVAGEWALRCGLEIWDLPETRHEPFNEWNRNTTFQRLVEWLDERRQRWVEGDI